MRLAASTTGISGSTVTSSVSIISWMFISVSSSSFCAEQRRPARIAALYPCARVMCDVMALLSATSCSRRARALDQIAQAVAAIAGCRLPYPAALVRACHALPLGLSRGEWPLAKACQSGVKGEVIAHHAFDREPLL